MYASGPTDRIHELGLWLLTCQTSWPSLRPEFITLKFVHPTMIYFSSGGRNHVPGCSSMAALNGQGTTGRFVTRTADGANHCAKGEP